MLQELDDEDFVTELVSAFLEECKEATEQCQKAKDAKNLDEVRSAAHGLKGSAAIFGADSLSETAKTLEFAIKVRLRRPAAGAAAPPPIALQRRGRAGPRPRCALRAHGRARAPVAVGDCELPLLPVAMVPDALSRLPLRSADGIGPLRASTRRQVDNVTDWDVLGKMIDDLVEHVESLDQEELKVAAAAMA